MKTWTKIDYQDAWKIVQWNYEPPYDMYNMELTGEAVKTLCEKEYFVCKEDDEIMGYCCFGTEARIPTEETDVYQGEAVDIGLGRRPDLCGKGTGTEFFREVLEFAQTWYPFKHNRVTVAAWNIRAISVYERMGLRVKHAVTHEKTGEPFIIMENKTGDVL